MGQTHAQEQDGAYIGRLTQSQIENILNVIGQEHIPELDNLICNYPISVVEASIKQNKSVRAMLQEVGVQPSQFLGKLRPEQTVGVAFMYYSPRSILGDGVGLGKTVEISALLNLLMAKKELIRVLIAVETGAVEQVQRELLRFPGLKIAKVTGTGASLEKELSAIDWSSTRGLVVAHSKLPLTPFSALLAQHLDENGKSTLFNTFVLDESSVVKNKDTQLYKMVQEISGIVDRVHFLNATALEISLKDVYAQIDLLDDMALPKWWRIQKEHCIMRKEYYWIKIGGKATQRFKMTIADYKNQELFRQRVRLFYMGRNVDNKDLGNTYRVIELLPTAEQQMRIAQGYRPNAVLNCPVLDETLNLPMTPDRLPKLRTIYDLLAERQGKKVYIYCFNIAAQQSLYDIAVSLGRTPRILNGSCSAKEKQELRDAFNEGDVDTLISNIQRSLNLYAGNTCIYYSIEGNPARMEQIRGRIDRHVDETTKEFILLVYKNTDEYRWLVDVARQRSKAANELTTEAKTATTLFIDSMLKSGQLNLSNRRARQSS